MGGGKHQKGGKHGFIGRTLAHDILAKQAKMSEGGYVDRQYKQPEQSVFERNSLAEFTMAAEQGLESYLNTHCTTKEVMASDFNSQLTKMINYSDITEAKVFPVIPIPRRCLFFEDTQREIIGKLIKQREHEQSIKEKRKNKRRNKKLVDLYMHGTGPKPAHGIYEPKRHAVRAQKMVHGYANAEQDGDSEEFSGLDDDDYGSCLDSGSSDGDTLYSDGDNHLDTVNRKNAGFPNSDTTKHTKAYNDRVEPELTHARKTQTQGLITDVNAHFEDLDETDEWEDVDENDYDDEAFYEEDDDDEFETEEEKTEEHIEVTPKIVPANEVGMLDASKEDATKYSTHVNGKIKYVEEYQRSIKEEIEHVDICKINSDELNRIETKCFYAWRRLLSRIEEVEGRIVTPYEKNIEFWRQLWRVVERSHVVLIIVDARDPLFFRVPDLEMYIKEVDERKETILVLNKADYLSVELRKEWALYFKEQGIDFLFFSTIWGRKHTSEPVESDSLEENTDCTVYNVDMLIRKLNKYRKKQSKGFPELNSAENPENPLYTVGFVGYPNVGKSSLINCLLEVTKTTVSCTPGKTKHFQTLALKKANITLCDCPGLIFPNIVATKHHLLVNGIVSASHFRGSLIFAIQLICNRIPKQLCELYDVNLAECVIMSRDNRKVLFSQRFLEYICNNRKFYAGGKGGQLDIGRAAKLVLKDYVSGNLLYCAWPPGLKPLPTHADIIDYGEEDDVTTGLSRVKLGTENKKNLENELKTPHEMKLAEAKMQQWLMNMADDLPHAKEKPMTKRKMRFLMKGKRKQSTMKKGEPYV
ncbi:GTPase subfamily protein [Babesia divergens]|uniref:GTPase subfamily protein n=1 Tax=Babesia divergens TaxID=32595 RepID=A0AAD9GCR4_BABDI|nr:GTPase subfamily protein [Babesia divergens]